MSLHWQRWIHSSIATHFKEGGKPHSVPFYLETESRGGRPNHDQVEIRWDGPSADESTKNHWRLDIEVNLLISTLVDGNNPFRHQQVQGLVQSLFPSALPVYKYGEVPGFDDQTLLGCLQLRREDREAIVTSYFGKIDADISIEQSTVEAHYRMFLKTGS